MFGNLNSSWSLVPGPFCFWQFCLLKETGFSRKNEVLRLFDNPLSKYLTFKIILCIQWKIIKRSGTSFCCIFSVWFFYKIVLFSFSRYQTKCIIELLFRQLMTSWTLRFIFDHPLKQWPTGRNRGKDKIQKTEYLKDEKSFLDEIKSIFQSFWRAIIWWKKKLMKIVGPSFKHW